MVFAALTACTLTTNLDGYTSSAKADAGQPIDAGKHDSSVDPDKLDAADASDDDDAPDASIDAPPPPTDCSDTLLVGSNVMAGTVDDGMGHNVMDTYGYIAINNGTAACGWLYVQDPVPPIAGLGIYAPGSSGKPGALLGKAIFYAPVHGWNVAKINVTLDITTGTTVWMGGTGFTSGLGVREHENGGCGALHDWAGGVGNTDFLNPADPNPASFTTACEELAYLAPLK
jgi:hypothetical protein